MRQCLSITVKNRKSFLPNLQTSLTSKLRLLTNAYRYEIISLSKDKAPANKINEQTKRWNSRAQREILKKI